MVWRTVYSRSRRACRSKGGPDDEGEAEAPPSPRTTEGRTRYFLGSADGAALAPGVALPVPEPLAFCDDKDVTGAVFYAMRTVEGKSLYNAEEADPYISEDKRQALRVAGAEVIVTPNAPPSDPRHFQAVAAKLAEERGWFLTDQFNNPANVRAHVETTALELLEQTNGKIGMLARQGCLGGRRGE